MRDWRNLGGKNVTVHAQGIIYRGTVVEMGETSLLLKAAVGFREIPWDRITGIEEADSNLGPDLNAGAHGPPPKGWA